MVQPHLTIKKHFRKLKDPRRNHRRRHLLLDIIVIAICAVICGCDDWQQVATFGRERRAWLQAFLELPNGIPSHDTFERVFDRFLLEDIQSCFAQAFDNNFAGLQYDQYATEEKGHGRTEKRHYTILIDPPGLRQADLWKDLHVIGICVSERTVTGQEPTMEARYFIGSRYASAKIYGRALRNHWGIENNLHWQLDVSFGEDNNRVSKRHGAENLAVLRRLALTLLKQHPDKRSFACKRLAAALNTDFLQEVLRGAGGSAKV
jgi:predicted transposase YbfD/YdcC